MVLTLELSYFWACFSVSVSVSVKDTDFITSMKFQCPNLTLIRYWESLGEVGRSRWNIYVPCLRWIVLRPCFFAGMWWECQICFCFVRFSSRVLASPAPGVGTRVEVPLQERGRCRTLSRQSWGKTGQTSRLKTTYQAIPAARYEIIDSMTLYVTGVLLALDTWCPDYAKSPSCPEYSHWLICKLHHVIFNLFEE